MESKPPRKIKKRMNTYNPRIADWQDAQVFMEQAVPLQNVCKCGKVIEHGGKSPWCNLWCPEYRKYLASKPKSKLDLVIEKKRRQIDNNLFAQALGVVL